MIIGNLATISQYKGLNKNLDTALDYILSHNLIQLPLGKTVIDGENVFVNHFEYEPIPVEACFFEGHQSYTDIHIVYKGAERFGVTHIEFLTPETEYDPLTDFTKYSGPIHTITHLVPGQFIMTFPEDIHMPKIKLENTPPQLTKKLVFKVKLRD